MKKSIKTNKISPFACSGLYSFFVFTSTSLFNSFSKFYCKFTCPLDARSHFVVFMFIFFLSFCFRRYVSIVLWPIDTHHHRLCSFYFSDWLSQELRLFAKNRLKIRWRYFARRHSNKCLASAAGEPSHVFVFMICWQKKCYVFCSNLEISRRREFLMMQRKYCFGSHAAEIQTLK